MPSREGDDHVEGTLLQGEQVHPLTPTDSGLARLGRIGAIVAALIIVPIVAAAGWQLLPSGSRTSLVVSALTVTETPGGPTFASEGATTGSGSRDAALDRFLASEFGAGTSAMLDNRVSCGALPWGNRPVLPCAPGEALGTSHSLVLAGCESGWLTPEVANEELRTLFSGGAGSAARVRTGDDYSAVVTWPGASQQSLVLMVTGSGITSFKANCDVPEAAVSRE